VTTTAEQMARPLLLVEEARARMLDGLEPLPAHEVALDEAPGRVLAADLASLTTLPPWDNSAMDGFALRAADVSEASEARPVTLRVVGELAAGRLSEIGVEPGCALRILTGAPLPPGADAVVPVEQTDADPGVAELPGQVAISSAVATGAHIRRAGSDLEQGRPILARGALLTPAALAVAAAGGHALVSAHRRPRLAVLSTGDELVPAGQRLGPAQIPDSNTPGIMAAARDAGAEVRSLGIARDSLGSVIAALRAGLEWADVIVASGGVSVGAHDVVKDAFAAVGRIDLWRVAVQPGKPLAFGRATVPDREREVLLFGLPGNPVSSLVTFELFVRPVLRRMAGHSDVIGRDVVSATLAAPVRKAAGRRAFIRVRLEGGENGWRAVLAGGQDSHVLSALAAADGLAVVPEDVDELDAGAQVEVIRIR
jgi:molybdopterin molybdotransferase